MPVYYFGCISFMFHPLFNISLFHHPNESLSAPPPPTSPPTKKNKSGKRTAIVMLIANDVMKLRQMISIL